MKSILELTKDTWIKTQSSENDRADAKDQVAYDHITITEHKDDHVKAKVTTRLGHERRLEIEAEKDVLSWSCTCGSASGKNDVFCKHAIAVIYKLRKTSGG